MQPQMHKQNSRSESYALRQRTLSAELKKLQELKELRGLNNGARSQAKSKPFIARAACAGQERPYCFGTMPPARSYAVPDPVSVASL